MDELERKSVDEFRKARKTPVIVVLDNIRSMHNVGSVFRTADAFLLEGIALCGYTPQPPHRDIHKTALGATETVQWTYFETTLAAIGSLRNEGYRIVAVEQVANARYLHRYEPSASQKIALVLGNEVGGVDPNVLQLSDDYIEIPQAGTKHSLNIAVAAGIVLWELFKKYQSNESE